MIQLLFFLISLISSVIGAICGIGGGVIIKPVLDATGVMGVSEVSFLSGCTVLSMSIVSFIRNRTSGNTVEVKTGTALALGSILGGLIGKMCFDMLKTFFSNENHLGAVQAVLLIIITLGTLLMTLFSQKIKTLNIQNIFFCVLIGLILGMISSFLGIGGGPVNLMVLSFFFSMDMKKAAANSLYIIMLSQISSLVHTLLNSTVPAVDYKVLILMVLAGIWGGMIGSRICRKISDRGMETLFTIFMALIIMVNVYNLIKFTLA